MKRMTFIVMVGMLQALPGFLRATDATYAVAVNTDAVRDVRAGETVTATIHPSLPTFTFNLVPDVPSNTIARIDVFVGHSTRPAQSISAGQAESPYRDSEYFKVVDINFDGYQDIGLLTWWGATGNQGWQFWRFDPRASQFVPDDTLSALGAPEFDAKSRTVRSFSKSSGCDFTWTTYHYRGKQLVPIEEERCSSPADRDSGGECDCVKRKL